MPKEIGMSPCSLPFLYGRLGFVRQAHLTPASFCAICCCGVQGFYGSCLGTSLDQGLVFVALLIECFWRNAGPRALGIWLYDRFLHTPMAAVGFSSFCISHVEEIMEVVVMHLRAAVNSFIHAILVFSHTFYSCLVVCCLCVFRLVVQVLLKSC